MHIFREDTWEIALRWFVVKVALTSLERRLELSLKWSRGQSCLLEVPELITRTWTLHLPRSAQMVFRSSNGAGTSSHGDRSALEATDIVNGLSLISEHVPPRSQKYIFLLVGVFMLQAQGFFRKLENIGRAVLQTQYGLMVVYQFRNKTGEMGIFLLLRRSHLEQARYWVFI